jgi:hypothetical protein
MNRDQVKGTAKDVAGKVQEKVEFRKPPPRSADDQVTTIVRETATGWTSRFAVQLDGCLTNQERITRGT